MTPEISKHLSQFAVRISSQKTVCGSGVVAYTNLQNSLIYVITAKHCLWDESDNVKLDITVDFYNSENKTFYSVKPNKILLSSENLDYDIAILIINDNSIIDLFKNIPTICLSNTIPQTESSYYFRGFPVGSADFPENISCSYSDDLSKILKLIPNRLLETNTTVALNNVRNFSGSGVWVKHDNTFYLVGILTDFNESFSGFECEKISQINSILDLDSSYPRIDFLNIFSVLIQKTPYSQIRQIINQRLNRIGVLINTFMPDVALNEIELIKPIVQLHSQDKNEHLGKCYYLEALAKASSTTFYELEYIDELFKKAVELVPDSILFKERLILIYIRNNQKEEALRISQEIVIEDSLNIRAWAFIDAYYKDFKSPSEVIKTILYKGYRITLISYFNDDVEKLSIDVEDIRLFLEDDCNKMRVPEESEIVCDNLLYWSYLLDYILHQYFVTIQPIRFNNYREQFYPHPILDYAYATLSIILRTVEGTQMVSSINVLILKCRYLHLDFIINGNKVSILNLYEEFKKLDILKTNWVRQMDLIQSLLEIEEYDKIFEIVDLLPTVFPDMYLICADAATKKEDSELALKYYIEFLDSISEVSGNVFPNIRHAIYNLLDIYQYPINDIIKKTSKWTFQDDNVKLNTLVTIYYFFGNDQEKAELIKILDDLVTIINTSDYAFEMIIFSLFKLNRFQDVKHYLKPRIQFDESVNIIYLHFYLVSLFESMKLGNADENDSVMLLEGLSYWRKKCSPDGELLQIELTLADVNMLNKPTLVEEVAIYGTKHFPNLHWFIFKRIESIFHQNKDIFNSPDLDEIFNEELLSLNLQPECMMQMGFYTIKYGKKELGLEICYQATKRNPQIKRLQIFFLINPIINDYIKDIPQPSIVELGCVVRFTLDRKNFILLIDEECSINNRDIKDILGRKEGEQFKIIDFEKSVTKYFRIDNIFNKYEGYKAIINKDISNDDSQYDGIIALDFETDDGQFDIDKFNDTLKELGGFDGTRKQIILKEAFDKFENYEMGFNNFINHFDDPLAIYRHLTTYSFFPIRPLIHHPNVDIKIEKEFILDFSSLFLLCDMTNEVHIDFSGIKFIISQFMMDFIIEKISELAIGREVFSLSVTHERVIPLFNREDYYENLRREYDALLIWIKKYCKVGNNEKRLGILSLIAQSEIINRRRNNLNSSYIDAVLLSDDANKVFLTNDSTIYNSPAGRGGKASCEYFLDKLFPTKQNEVKAFLILKNYRGVTISDENLWAMYSKNALMNVWGDFNKCIDYSLSDYNPNPKNIHTIIKFLKKLFLEQNAEISYRQRITKQLFKAVFTNMSFSNMNEIYRILNLIDQEFHFMPIHHFQIKNAIKDVLDEMNLANHII